MRIQHNVMAMNAYRNYNNNTKALSGNLEKLSSGYRINRAGDDAAGLAISEKMRAQITGLDAATKNVKDGISLVKTAEGAMQEVQDMLNRMTYLATQSANGTYENEVDRENLQKEVVSLKSEINRIADSANFNGQKLLNGELDTNAKARHFDATSVMVLSEGKVLGTAAGKANKSNPISFSAGTTHAGQKLNAEAIVVYLDEDGKTQTESVKFSYDGATKTAEAQNAINAFTKAVKDNDTLNGLFNFTNGATSQQKLTIENKKVGKVATSTAVGQANVKSIAFAVKNAESGETVTNSIQAKNNDGAAATTGTDSKVTNLASAKFKAGDFVVIDGYRYNYAANADGKDGSTFKDFGSLQVAAQEHGIELRGDNSVYKGGSAMQLQIGDTSDTFNQLRVSVTDIHVKNLGISDVDIGTISGATKAIDKIKAAINTVSSTRGDLGAIQNRLDHTMNNLSVMRENIQDAESTIRDTDVADEMMRYTKNNILIQSSQAMLAQANQVPQGVLQLLQ